MVSEIVISEQRFFQHRAAVTKKLDVKAFVCLGEIRVTLQVQFCSASLVSTRDACICQLRA